MSMDTPNQDQAISWVRSTVAMIGGIAIGAGYGNAETWTMIGGVVTMAVPYVWGWFAHTSAAKLSAISDMRPSDKRAAFAQVPDSVKIAAVEAMPDVKRIVVLPTAKNGVAEAVADETRPKVVPA